jgi:hypothetical protein
VHVLDFDASSCSSVRRPVRKPAIDSTQSSNRVDFRVLSKSTQSTHSIDQQRTHQSLLPNSSIIMALMLAPYNSAMRLGMGFNSYTQALCVNDVVRKPGDIPANEGDLRAAQLTAKTDAATGKVKQITAKSLAKLVASIHPKLRKLTSIISFMSKWLTSG